MEGKRRYLYIGLFALLLMLVLVPAQSVEAKSNINPTKKTLKADKTYTSYDITGDNEADKIRINTYQIDDEWMCGGNVEINGKTCYTLDPADYFLWIDVKLYTLKNGKNFLYIITTEYNDYATSAVLLQYKSGKLKTVVDFYKTVYKFGTPTYDCKVKKVSGNTMTLQFAINSYTTSGTKFQMKYKYKNGTLKRTSNKTSTFSLNFKRGKNTFTTNKKLTVYSSPTSKKTKTLAKGTKIKITQIYQKGSQMYMKYKTTKTKKTGWIKCYKKSHSKDIFKKLYWAG